MKRLILILTSIVLFLCCLGCNQKTKIVKPVNFYYPSESVSYEGNDRVIRPEVRESKDHTNDLTGLVRLYLQGPVTQGFENPFPNDVTLRSFAIMDNEVIIELSAQFAQVTGLDHTLAVCSIAKTLYQLTNIEKVTIITEGVAEPLVLTNEDMMFIDAETTPTTIEE